MLHLESFLEELDQFKGVFYCSDDPVKIPKIDLLKLITLMKISNSLEEISNNFDNIQYDSGIADRLNELSNAIYCLDSTISKK